MKKSVHILNLACVFSLLLSSCALLEPSQWDPYVTPPAPAPGQTGAGNPFQLYPLLPGASSTPSATPLMVLPMGGTATPGSEPTPTMPPINTSGPMLVLKSHNGDTIDIIAKRARVGPQEIISDVNLPPPGVILQPGTLLLLPDRLPPNRAPETLLIPDSEFVLSPASIGFSTHQYVSSANGKLSRHREYLMSNAWTSGAEAVDRIALDNSLNPRLILAIIEMESRWVRGDPENFAQGDYPLGHVDFHYKGLFRQMMWASGELSVGYYEWRAGRLNEITFSDGSSLQLSPRLNAASAALMYFFAQTRDRARWEQAIASFPSLYAEMFGDPWASESSQQPILPFGLTQPELSLPFEPGKVWSFTGGPHSAWERKGAMAALDFAPGASEQGCVPSTNQVLAPAAGLVVRVEPGVVILDLDGDGFEQTGWVLLFLHIANEDKVGIGKRLEKDDVIGRPSCEGGVSTGTHLHIARKYNGEWILAGGNIPFTMDGWVASEGEAIYKGALTRGDKVIPACTCSTFNTRVIREKVEP